MAHAAAKQAPAVEQEPERSPLYRALDAARLICSAAKANLEAEEAALRKAALQDTHDQAQVGSFANLEERKARASIELIKSGKSGSVHARFQQEAEELREAEDKARTSATAFDLQKDEHKAAEKVLQDARQTLSVEACKIIVGVDAAAAVDEARAAYRRIFEINDSVRGLEVMMLATFPTLPADAQVQLRAQLWRLLEALQPPKPPYVTVSVAEQNRRAAAAWRERHSELMK